MSFNPLEIGSTLQILFAEGMNRAKVTMVSIP